MITIQDLKKKYSQNNSSKSIKTVQPDGGKIGTIPYETLGYNAVTKRYYIDDTIGGKRGEIPETQVAAAMTLIQKLAMAGSHVDVKKDERWRAIYRRQQTAFRFINHAGNPVPQNLYSYPCHYCGIVLPEDFIQVDHRQPQAHPGVAVLKVMHAVAAPGAVPLTSARAQGLKGTNARTIGNASTGVAPAAGALPTVHPKGYPFGHGFVSANLAAPAFNAKANRYAITDAGQTFLSICVMYWGAGEMETSCLNSLLNLVPACPKCNGGSGKGSMVHARQ